MGFFKKSAAPSDDSAAQVKAAVGAGSMRKKKNAMAQIFNESVFEQVLDDMRANECCITTDDNGNEAYIALALDVTQSGIGGFDKKSRRDEAKGSIIECIKSGRIKTCITEELLDENLLVILPDAMTLTAMNEFALLTDADYEICIVKASGDIDLLGTIVHYRTVADIVSNDGMLESLRDDLDKTDDFDYGSDDGDVIDDDDDMDDTPVDDLDDLPVDDTPMGSGGFADNGLSDDELDEAEADDPLESAEAEYDDDIDDDVDLGVDDVDVDFNVDGMDMNTDVDATGFQPGAGYDEVLAEADESSGYDETAPDFQVPEEWTAEAVTRRFANDELGLVIDTTPFDAEFLSKLNLDYRPFDVSRPETGDDSWMNKQLNEMCRNFNATLHQMHRTNLFNMRTNYFQLISKQYDRIQSDLDIHDESTQVGQLYAALQDEREAAMDDVPKIVAERKAELDRKWMDKLKEVGLAAAYAAQSQYTERYGTQHEDQIATLEDSVRASIAADFQEAEQELRDQRRAEAASVMDMSISETLDEIASMYVGCKEAEEIAYQQMCDDLKHFQDDYRQDAIARTRALQEQLNQSNEADRVRASFTHKTNDMIAQHNQAVQELRDQMISQRNDAEARLKQSEADADRRVARVQDELEVVKKTNEKLNDQLIHLDEAKGKEYEARLNEKDDEIASWKSRLENTEEIHRFNNRRSTFLIITAVIASVAIGIIVGFGMSSHQALKQQQQAIAQQSMSQTYQQPEVQNPAETVPNAE